MSESKTQATLPVAIQRAELLILAQQTQAFDVLVIGGGATGLGVAVDAAQRGLSVLLVEAQDFAKGTSSRATKLLHGGVRYLAQGDIALVREALHERTVIMHNAPHLASAMPFITPVYGFAGRWFYKWFYGIGLVLYDFLAGKAGLGKTEILSAAKVIDRMPGVRTDKLAGAVQYWDGQFDDARLAVALARTAADQGACVLNHCRASELLHVDGKVVGAKIVDMERDNAFAVHAGCVINATGVWVDEVRRMDRSSARDIIVPSQGVHLVVDREFLPGGYGLLVPRTRDKRVLFAVPWLGKVILGTTDTPRLEIEAEPQALAEEVQFILDEAANYLSRAPTRVDVRSVWVGLRPLVKPSDEDDNDSKGISREHTVLVSASSLVTVTGGKWTTYRAMAEDVLERCWQAGLIPSVRQPSSHTLRLMGAPEVQERPVSDPPGLHSYGLDALVLRELPGHQRELVDGLTEAMVRFAARYEFARTVEDVLARRSRLLFLDAGAAIRVANDVAEILRDELGPDFDAVHSAQAFRDIAINYLVAA